MLYQAARWTPQGLCSSAWDSSLMYSPLLIIVHLIYQMYLLLLQIELAEQHSSEVLQQRVAELEGALAAERAATALAEQGRAIADEELVRLRAEVRWVAGTWIERALRPGIQLGLGARIGSESAAAMEGAGSVELG